MRTIISTELQNKDEFSLFYEINKDISYSFSSSKGKKQKNEDTCGVAIREDGAMLFCVTDGLGGHIGGKVASQTAIEGAFQYFLSKQFEFENHQSISQLIFHANQAILNKQKEIPNLQQMRSTIVILVIKDNLAIWGHIGDVRLYHFRNGIINHQTKDHSVPQMLVDMGEISYNEIREHSDRSRLLYCPKKPKSR